MTQESGDPKDDNLMRERVAHFLRDNPDFLPRNPDLLHKMVPPDRHFGDGVSDIQTAMIGQLRSEIARLHAGQEDYSYQPRQPPHAGAGP